MKEINIIIWYLTIIMCFIYYILISSQLGKISNQLEELIKVNTPEAINVIDEKFVLEKKI